MSSPNQHTTPEDKALGYPFAVHCTSLSVPGLPPVSGRDLHRALTAHGLEELEETVLAMTLMHPTFNGHIVSWGYGRATTTYGGLSGWPEMPVYTVRELIDHVNNTINKETPSCVQ
jgi:hypothetical protein